MSSKFNTPFADARYHNVIGFLAAKGLLYAPGVEPRKSAKLPLSDVLWVAENAEPRVLEVLPAALLHFPRCFNEREKLPPDIQAVIAALTSGATDHPPCRGIPFHKIKFWANKQLPDRRVKPLSQRKIMRSFRLSPDVIAQIKTSAAAREISEADYLELLVRLAPDV